ncbi:MAG: glycoside hydrolase family 2, partial [Defluviitaleaceae bacterium]|nr:glycoside hydrolase family 2 [Defluviitaleaceae bacterium]
MENFNQHWQFKLETDAAWQPVQIPHDWLISDTKNLYKTGVGRYKKTFTLEPGAPGQRHFLRFDGIYMDSTLHVNGQPAGEWKNGYTTYTQDITDFVKPGENEVEVTVNYQSPNSRWYSGAGIYRDCWLITKNAAHFAIDGIYITPVKINDSSKSWHVEIDAEVETAGRPYEMRHAIKHLSTGETLEAGQLENGDLLAHNPQLWDIDAPHCYILESQLLVDGKVTDTAATRFGFREIAYTTNDGFFLNNRRVEINGVCQHHDLGALGAAVHKDALRRQLQTLRSMGVNAIRTAHNPPAQALMELADEMGFLIQSEFTDMWKRPKTKYDYARFFPEWHSRDVAAWVRRDRNCPSVIMWSVGNEIYDTHASFEDGAATMTDLMRLVQRHDPKGHAPTTLCSNYMPWENTQKCADIIKLIGYNYAEYLYHDHHAKHPSWIIYGGETSSTVQSRGIYHFPLKKSLLSDDDLQCSALGNSSVSWGAKNTEACITDHRDAPFALGQFLWTGTDYIGEPTPYHTKNSYFGQIDTAGFPKDSFYIYKSAWTSPAQSPFVHLYPYWDFSP